MIDFDKYDIKIRYFAIHPAGVVEDVPFLIKTETFNPEAFPNLELWTQFFEKYRGKELIIHELGPHKIRFSEVAVRLPIKKSGLNYTYRMSDGSLAIEKEFPKMSVGEQQRLGGLQR